MVMKRPMFTFLSQLLLAIRSRFTRRARPAPTAGSSTTQILDAREYAAYSRRGVMHGRVQGRGVKFLSAHEKLAAAGE